MNSILSNLSSISENYKLLSSIIVIAITLITKQMISRLVMLKLKQEPLVAKKQIAFISNLSVLFALMVIGGIWISDTTGAIFSIAAVAGAILIINKEVILNGLGYLVLQSTGIYKIGDFIEIGGVKGRVSDIKILHTIIAEGGPLNQLTGKSVAIPNNKLTTEFVRNISATGRYIIVLQDIVLPITADLEVAEKCAIEAAEDVCEDWLIDADQYLSHFEKSELIDLPSAKPRVLFGSISEKAILMQIRFSCDPHNRVKVEQAIYRGFWGRFKKEILSSSTQED